MHPGSFIRDLRATDDMTSSVREHPFDGIPHDEQILSLKLKDLADWLRTRVSGEDTSWNPRTDDDPASLVRVLLQERQDIVRDHLVDAIALALQSLSPSLSSKMAAPSLKALLEVAGACARVPPGKSTRGLATVLDTFLRLLNKDELADKNLLKLVLLARAGLRPAPLSELWKHHLNDRDLAIAAFRCALGAHTSATRTAAFVKLAELDAEARLPGFSHQARLLREHVDARTFEACIQALAATSGPIGLRAQTLALALEVPIAPPVYPTPPALGTTNTDVQVTAFIPTRKK
jgi:hypothetical protein